MKNALQLAEVFDHCDICGRKIALVDEVRKKSAPSRGGQWIHVELPDTPHPARPSNE